MEEFAGSRFITCFTHWEQEDVALRCLYGKNVKQNKVLLQFKNFGKILRNVYVWISLK